MIRIAMTGAALAMSFPALAQTTATDVADPSASQMMQQPAGPASTSAEAQATTSAPVQPATPATSASAAAQVSAVINSEFPVYDADKSGELNEAEFSKWLVALKTKELETTGKTMPQADLTAWASAAFASADTDKSTMVSKPELTRFLGG